MGAGLPFSLMSEIFEYTLKQLEHFFPDRKGVDKQKMVSLGTKAHERALYCFSHTTAFHNHQGKVNFLHGDQYAAYLYFLSNEAYLNDYRELYSKSALLNKCLHGIDLFGHVEMPRVFHLIHPMGSIVGRAKIGERLVIYQNITIGGKHTEQGIDYPVIGNDVCLFSSASVIGNCQLGDGAIVAANANIIDTTVPANTMVAGSYPNNIQKPLKADLTSKFFI